MADAYSLLGLHAVQPSSKAKALKGKLSRRAAGVQTLPNSPSSHGPCREDDLQSARCAFRCLATAWQFGMSSEALLTDVSWQSADKQGNACYALIGMQI